MLGQEYCIFFPKTGQSNPPVEMKWNLNEALLDWYQCRGDPKISENEYEAKLYKNLSRIHWTLSRWRGETRHTIFSVKGNFLQEILLLISYVWHRTLNVQNGRLKWNWQASVYFITRKGNIDGKRTIITANEWVDKRFGSFVFFFLFCS